MGSEARALPVKTTQALGLSDAVGHPECPNPLPVAARPDITEDIKANRIAHELSKLHRDGGISRPNDPEAMFYACLIRQFGATYSRRLEE
jgi:hypothetical protein